MLENQVFLDMLNNPVRELVGRVELYIYEDSTLVRVCGANDALQSFSIERVGENKFFGYGICHRLNFKLVDMNREISVSTKNYIEAELGIDNEYIYPFPAFYVTEVNRDENTNQLSVTAYDVLYKAGEYTVSEIDFPASYSVREFLTVCANVLGVPLNVTSDNPVFDLEYPNGANFTGKETIRDAMNHVAEITQTIYFINNNWELCFKELDKDGEPVLTVDKSKYMTLKSNDNKRLGSIIHVTELDSVSASIQQEGSTQYIRENPFWTLRDDIGALLNDAIERVGGLTINQFDCTWRGNWLLEIGDKIGLIGKDDTVFNTYLLNDVITYDGALKEKTQWQYDNNDTETTSAPATISGALKQATAKVDRINNEITLMSSEIDGVTQSVAELKIKSDEIDLTVRDNIDSIAGLEGNISDLDGKIDDEVANLDGRINTNVENIAQLQVKSDTISATVESNATNTNAQLDTVNQNMDTLNKKVAASVTAEDVEILISTSSMSNSASVTTSTGFTFNEDGMTVSKSTSEISTTITEDGMRVNRNDETLLTANNQGVIANNLRSNYIIISNRCRFEKYGSDRAGCYWLGGE